MSPFASMFSSISQSSNRRSSTNKGVLKDFAKFTGKHLCQSRLRPATLLKKDTLTHVFSCEFCEIYKNSVLTEHLWATASVFLAVLK